MTLSSEKLIKKVEEYNVRIELAIKHNRSDLEQLYKARKEELLDKSTKRKQTVFERWHI